MAASQLPLPWTLASAFRAAPLLAKDGVLAAPTSALAAARWDVSLPSRNEKTHAIAMDRQREKLVYTLAGLGTPGGNPLSGLQIPKSFRGVTVVANHSNRSQF